MSNPWASFLSLLPSTNRWIGRVSSTPTTGKVRVDIPNTTDSILVDGDGSSFTIGEYVFVENGVIVSTAPPLRSVTEGKVY